MVACRTVSLLVFTVLSVRTTVTTPLASVFPSDELRESKDLRNYEYDDYEANVLGDTLQAEEDYEYDYAYGGGGGLLDDAVKQSIQAILTRRPEVMEEDDGDGRRPPASMDKKPTKPNRRRPAAPIRRPVKRPTKPAVVKRPSASSLSEEFVEIDPTQLPELETPSDVEDFLNNEILAALLGYDENEEVNLNVVDTTEPDGLCRTGEKWTDGCNWCFCKERKPTCTDKPCFLSQEPVLSCTSLRCSVDERCEHMQRHCTHEYCPSTIPVCVPPDPDFVLYNPNNGTCQHGERWHDGCNPCYCDTGVPFCAFNFTNCVAAYGDITCEDVLCGRNQKCFMLQRVCTYAPCPPLLPVCVPKREGAGDTTAFHSASSAIAAASGGNRRPGRPSGGGSSSDEYCAFEFSVPMPIIGRFQFCFDFDILDTIFRLFMNKKR